MHVVFQIIGKNGARSVPVIVLLRSLRYQHLSRTPSFTNNRMVFRSFAVVGAGNIGSFIIDELLRLKVIGTVSSITVVSRSVRISRPVCSHFYEPDPCLWMPRI